MRRVPGCKETRLVAREIQESETLATEVTCTPSFIGPCALAGSKTKHTKLLPQADEIRCKSKSFCNFCNLRCDHNCCILVCLLMLFLSLFPQDSATRLRSGGRSRRERKRGGGESVSQHSSWWQKELRAGREFGLCHKSFISLLLKY